MRPTGFTSTPTAPQDRRGPIRRTLQLALRARPASRALEVAILGPDHPLVQASDLLHSISRQSVVVAGALLGSTVAYLAGQRWAWTLMLGAGIVLAILTLLAAGLQQCRRDRAIDLILKGCQNMPIAAIQCQRQRLLSRRTRTRLARNIRQTVKEVSKPAWQAREVALFHRQTVANATDDLLAVANALEADHVSAQGAARAERLISDGTSPFYGQDVIALRAELHRIHHDLLAP
jgi:hypothetical protein